MKNQKQTSIPKDIVDAPLATPMNIMQRSSVTKTVNKLNREFTGKISPALKCTLPFQRHSGVWANVLKSELIVSVLLDGYIPPVLLLKVTPPEDKSYNEILDGQQRLTTIFDFIEGRFKLHSSIRPVTIDGVSYDIAGCTYSELPVDVQDAIKNYNFVAQIFDNYTYDQAEELFYRINSGVALSPFQKAKAKLGADLMDFLTLRLNEDYFTQGIKITEAQARKEADLGILLQMMIILDSVYQQRNYKNITASTCLKYAEEIRAGYTDTQRAIVKSTISYLSEAFKTETKFLNVNNSSVIGLVASVALAKGIAPDKFKEFIAEFADGVSKVKESDSYTTNYEMYKLGSGAGNIRADKVEIRLDALLAEMCKHFHLNATETSYSFSTYIPTLVAYTTPDKLRAVEDTAIKDNADLAEFDKASEEGIVVGDAPKKDKANKDKAMPVGVYSGKEENSSEKVTGSTVLEKGDKNSDLVPAKVGSEDIAPILTEEQQVPAGVDSTSEEVTPSLEQASKIVKDTKSDDVDKLKTTDKTGGDPEPVAVVPVTKSDKPEEGEQPAVEEKKAPATPKKSPVTPKSDTSKADAGSEVITPSPSAKPVGKGVGSRSARSTKK